MILFNHFDALLNPRAILNACSESGSLDALPISAKRSADQISGKVPHELAEHDAAVDELYRPLIAKTSKTSAKLKDRVGDRPVGDGRSKTR
jgi:hypothetical protein